MTTKPLAKINDWIEIKDARGDSYLIGHVELHPNQAEFNGYMQQTSRIVARQREKLSQGLWVDTENTRYILGPEALVANDPVNLEAVEFGGTD